jgi:DNA-binding NarL/FixJ family response regulator
VKMAMLPSVPEPAKREQKPLGLVWTKCPQPLLSLRLEKTLKARAHVHRGPRPPVDTPSLVVLCANEEDIAPEVRNVRARVPEAPVLVLGPRAKLPLARAALRAGARGFIHAQMPPEQVVRALEVASKGEVTVPRELLRAMVEEEKSSAEDLTKLPAQKQEILALVAEGLTNAQIARRFFLSESTIKQHLSAAYKVLGVRNRNQAARLFRREGLGQGQPEAHQEGGTEPAG